jgi:hypothetical protein
MRVFAVSLERPARKVDRNGERTPEQNNLT